MVARELALPTDPPVTVDGWRAAAQALLSPPCCVFHRNVEISALYAWLYEQLPTCFKWAGMAAIASHHVRLVLYPFRLDADRTGYVDLPRSLSRGFLLADVDRMRQVNNAIYDDIVWVHLAFLAALGDADGMARLRELLAPHPAYGELLLAFETIERGRVLSAQGAGVEDRQAGADLIWAGNLAVLRHEQRAVVQPLFDGLSGGFARLASMGATTTFEVRGMRRELRYLVSFPAYSLTRGLGPALRARRLPSITRFENRWQWLESAVVPRFRRLDEDRDLVARTIDAVVAGAERDAHQPCLVLA